MSNSSAKSTTEMALNTAMMVAFAIPEGGVVVGAFLAVGSFIVGILWPDSQQSVPPECLPATKAQIDADFENFKKELEGILANGTIKADLGAVQGRLVTLHYNWGQILKVKIDQTGYQFSKDPNDTNFIPNLDAYFNIGASHGPMDDTSQYLADIPLTGLPDTKTFSLYSLIASLRVAYLKYAVVWAWGKQLRSSLLYTDYLQAHKAYNTACDADPTYADTHPKPVPPDPSVSSPLPEWQDWCKTDTCPVPDLLNEVNALLRTCEGPKGTYTTIAAHWADRDQQIKARVANFTTGYRTDPQDGTNWFVGDGYYVNDGATGVFTFADQSSELALAWRDIMIGSQVAYLWDKLTSDYFLDGVKEDDITNFGKTIEQWKAIRDSVHFQTYTMNAGDTLVKIAHAFYTPAILGLKLLSANPAFQDDPQLLTHLTTLTIPGSPTPYAIQPGDTLTSVADSQLKTGDAMDLYKANSLALEPLIVVPGAVFNVPDLADPTKIKFQVSAQTAGKTLADLAAGLYSDTELTTKIHNANDPTLTDQTIIIPDGRLRIPYL